MVAWRDQWTARWSAFGLVFAVACGGSSKRDEDDGVSGSGGDVAVGGAGGTGGTPEGGGTGAFGATGALGGTGALSGTGGSAAVSGQGGSGALAGTGGSAAVSGQGGSGALAGTGGSAAVSGQGGSGGDGCTLGGSCRLEGSQCRPNPDVVECCPTVYACEGAEWVQTPSECGSTPCPESLPENGAACGPCYVECPYDMCSSGQGGKNLEAECGDGVWYIAELPCFACCDEDSDCDSNFCVQGRCALRNHGVGCLRDDECGAGEVCAGARLCPCGSREGCKGDDEGACVPDGIGCCVVDSDCGEDQTCVAGVCKTNVSGGDLCWRNEDCEFGCTITYPCPCGQSCSGETKGICWIPV